MTDLESLKARVVETVDGLAGGRYGPKLLQRVLRVQRALTLAQDDDDARLAAVAAAAGYADQAHMTREIRGLCGTTPGRLFRDKKSAFALSDLFTVPGARRR